MHDAPSRPPEHVHLLRALASLALDYLRWTQLVPMLLAWTTLVLVVGALLLTNFQDASFSLLERGIAAYEQTFGPIAPDGPDVDPSAQPSTELPAGSPPPEDGAIRITEDDIFPFVLRTWALLALVGWLLGVLRTLLFGPREPARLGQKLRIAAYAAAGCSALMWIAYALGSETFHGSAGGWAALFIGGPAVVWLISAWSLCVGYLICHLQRRLHA